MTDVVNEETVLVENDPRLWLKTQMQEEYQWKCEHGLYVPSPSNIYNEVRTWAGVDIQEMMWFYTVEDQGGDVAEFWKAVETVVDRESYDEWVYQIQSDLFLPMFKESKISDRSEKEVCQWAWAMRGLDRLRIVTLARMIQSGSAEYLETNYRGDILGKYWYEASDWSMMSDALTTHSLTKEQPVNIIIGDLVENHRYYGRRTPNYYILIKKPGEWQKRGWMERRERQENESVDL